MGKQVKLLTVGIVFVLAQKKLTATALDPMQSKATGAVILTRRITYPAKNGNAAEVNQ